MKSHFKRPDAAPSYALLRKELAALGEAMKLPERHFPPGRDFIHQGQVSPHAYLLDRGWVCIYHLMPNGNRHIVDFGIPGHIVGLRGLFQNRSDESFEALEPVVAHEVSRASIERASGSVPSLCETLIGEMAWDHGLVTAHLVNSTRREADSRLAHLMLELASRLQLVGLGEPNAFRCPLTQGHLADALGITPLHVSRVLRDLREADLLEFSNNEVRFLNRRRLVDLAEFDDSYLSSRESGVA